MNILEQNKEKINGKLETFDRILILRVNATNTISLAFTFRIPFAFTLRITQIILQRIIISNRYIYWHLVSD